MLHDQLVKEVMVPIKDYPQINMNASIGEAIKIFRKKFVTNSENGRAYISHKPIIVLDGYGKTVGILTIRSLLKAIDAEANKKNTFSPLLLWASFFKKHKTNEHQNVHIKDIMRSVDYAYIYENEPVTKAVNIILTKHVNLLPVVENPKICELTQGEYPPEHLKVVGIIRTIDIFAVISDLLEWDDNIITFPAYK